MGEKAIIERALWVGNFSVLGKKFSNLFDKERRRSTLVR